MVYCALGGIPCVRAVYLVFNMVMYRVLGRYTRCYYFAGGRELFHGKKIIILREGDNYFAGGTYYFAGRRYLFRGKDLLRDLLFRVREIIISRTRLIISRTGDNYLAHRR